MSDELKLCPFCGELPEELTMNDVPAVICRNENCAFRGSGAVVAREHWQRRASGGWPFRSDEPCRYTGEPEEKAEHPGPFPSTLPTLPTMPIPEPSDDLKEALERRFKMVMGHVRAYGNAQACGNSTEQNGQYMALEDHIQKLVESGLKFAGEGPVSKLRREEEQDGGSTTKANAEDAN